MAEEQESSLITLTEEEAQRALGMAIARKLGHDVVVRGYEVQFSADLLHKHIEVEFAPAPTPDPSAPDINFDVDPLEPLP